MTVAFSEPASTALLVVASLALAFAVHRRTTPTRRETAAALLASAWVLPFAVLAGFLDGGDPLARPDVLAARVLFWGFVPALALPRSRVATLAFIAIGLEIFAALSAGPGSAASLGRLAVRATCVLLGLVPGQLFARWTRERSRLATRCALHTLFHAALLLWLLPTVVALLGGGGGQIANFGSTVAAKLFWQILLVPAVLLLSAVQEFAERGGGTPMPDDPPETLVISGAYAYVANPMQIGKIGVVALWGAFWSSPWVVACAAVGLLYSLTIARVREERALAARFGADWSRYRAAVGRWRPRWRPYCRPDRPLAVLYLDLGCEPCGQLGSWLAAQHPIDLEVRDITSHVAAPLARMTYRPAEGGRGETGTSALARALEHIHLGWAFLGWAMRLPLVRDLAQLLADASGPEPRHRASAQGDGYCPRQPAPSP